jgi:hypothetical protein
MKKISKEIRQSKSRQRGFLKIEAFVNRFFRVNGTSDGRARGKGSVSGNRRPVVKK